MTFIAPRYEVPMVDAKTGRVTLEWYKFLVPLAKEAVPTTRRINTTTPVSGGGTLADDLTLTLEASGVTNAYLAQMATHTFKANANGGADNPQDLSATQATALLNAFTDTLQGLVPLSGGGAQNLLRADGSWTNAVVGSFGATTFLKTGSTVVGSLPAAATAGAGARMLVTDATVTTFASAVVGGGANTVPVYSDGAAWRIG